MCCCNTSCDCGDVLGFVAATVPDVYAACERFEKLGVEFVKKPDGGSMKVAGLICFCCSPQLRN